LLKGPTIGTNMGRFLRALNAWFWTQADGKGKMVRSYEAIGILWLARSIVRQGERSLLAVRVIERFV
jgi:hypothetical protein